MSIDETARLKLGVLADAQEMTPSEINDSLEMLDVLVDCYLLGQYVNTPPASPADGDAYLVGGAPTGAWTGYAYKIAWCVDGGWRFLVPFDGLRAFVAATGAFIVYQGGTWTDWNSLISASEASIASAATCDLGAAGSLFVCVTGTTGITGFGTAANRLRFVRFAQGLTLTHNATSLVLPGGANIVTAAGDTAVFASDGSGNWRCRSYMRANGQPVASALTASSLTATGLIDASASGAGQIKFPAAQNASANANTLDDYKEGTWTPSLGDANGHAMTMSARSGFYTKVGNLVAAFGYVQWSALGTVDGSTLTLSGLPFTSKSTSGARFAAHLSGYIAGVYTNGGKQVVCGTDNNQSIVTFRLINDGATPTNLPANACASSGELQVSLTYLTD